MRAQYRLRRYDYNLHTAFYGGDGYFGFPKLAPVYPEDVDLKALSWIAFDECLRTKKGRQGKGVHFFAHDYTFERVWNYPQRYVPLLWEFGCVCAPFFSSYHDWPRAVRAMSIYRNRWCGRYWQENGVTVIPTVSLQGREDWDWCFDGLPEGGMVALSSIGRDDQELREAVGELAARISPSGILWRGRVPKWAKALGVEVVKVHDICDDLKNLDAGWRHDRRG